MLKKCCSQFVDKVLVHFNNYNNNNNNCIIIKRPWSLKDPKQIILNGTGAALTGYIEKKTINIF